MQYILFFRFFSIIDCYKILNIVPSKSLLFIYFIYSSDCNLFKNWTIFSFSFDVRDQYILKFLSITLILCLTHGRCSEK